MPVPSLKLAITILLSAGVVLRLLMILLVPNKQVNDFAIFGELATAIVNGDGFAYTGHTGLTEDLRYLNNWHPRPPVKTAFRLPGYPMVLSVGQYFFGHSDLLPKCINLIIGVCIGVLIYLLLLSVNMGVAFYAALFWILTPSNIIANNLQCTELLFTVALLAGAFVLSQAVLYPNQKVSSALVFGAGLIIGGASLVRPATQVIFCAAIAIMFTSAGYTRKFLYTVLLLAGFILPLVLWGVRNYNAFGHFEMQTTEIGVGLHTLTKPLVPSGIDSSLDSLVVLMSTKTDEFELARIGKEIGQKRLMKALGRVETTKVLAHNMLRAWRDDLDPLGWVYYYGWRVPQWSEKIGLTLLTFCNNAWYLVFLVLGVFGARNIMNLCRVQVQNTDLQKWNTGIIMLFIYFSFAFVLLAVFEGQSRYHFPLMPFISMVAAAGLRYK